MTSRRLAGSGRAPLRVARGIPSRPRPLPHRAREGLAVATIQDAFARLASALPVLRREPLPSLEVRRPHERPAPSLACRPAKETVSAARSLLAQPVKACASELSATSADRSFSGAEERDVEAATANPRSAARNKTHGPSPSSLNPLLRGAVAPVRVIAIGWASRACRRCGRRFPVCRSDMRSCAIRYAIGEPPFCARVREGLTPLGPSWSGPFGVGGSRAALEELPEQRSKRARTRAEAVQARRGGPEIGSEGRGLVVLRRAPRGLAFPSSSSSEHPGRRRARDEGWKEASSPGEFPTRRPRFASPCPPRSKTCVRKPGCLDTPCKVGARHDHS